MSKQFFAMQTISPYSTEPKFYNLDDYELDGSYIPGMIDVNFDFEVQHKHPSKNISKIRLKTWFRVYANDIYHFAYFEFVTSFDTSDSHKTLSRDQCKDLAEKHVKDFSDRVSPKIIEFSNGEKFTIDESSLYNVSDLVDEFHQYIQQA